MSLNPCSNGKWSRRKEDYDGCWGLHLLVLILVLMEYGLGLYGKEIYGASSLTILILVLMEYGLGQQMTGDETKQYLMS